MIYGQHGLLGLALRRHRQIQRHAGRHHELRGDDEDHEQHERVMSTSGVTLMPSIEARPRRGPALAMATRLLPAPAPGGRRAAREVGEHQAWRATSASSRSPATQRRKQLYAATAGSATPMPTAAATSASAIALHDAGGGDRTVLAAPPARPSSSNARMTPMTVLNSPTNGALLPSVPR